jgi:hypothetical protein
LNPHDIQRRQRRVALARRLAVDDDLQRVQPKVGDSMDLRKTIGERGHFRSGAPYLCRRPLGISQARIGGDRVLILANFPAALRRRNSIHWSVEFVGNSLPDIFDTAKRRRFRRHTFCCATNGSPASNPATAPVHCRRLHLALDMSQPSWRLGILAIWAHRQRVRCASSRT